MKKQVKTMSVAEAVRQARADLHLENACVPEWGCQIFSRMESGQLSLADAHREIDQLVRLRIAKQ